MFKFFSKDSPSELDMLLHGQKLEVKQRAVNSLQELCHKHSITICTLNKIVAEHNKIVLTTGVKRVEYTSLNGSLEIQNEL